MNSAKLLSVCLCGAGLFAAVILLVDKGAPSTRTEAVRTVEASPKPAVQVKDADVKARSNRLRRPTKAGTNLGQFKPI
jgi:hypothetical protein